MPPLVAPDKVPVFGKDRPRGGAGAASKAKGGSTMLMGSLVALLLIVGVARMLISRPDPKASQRAQVVAAAEDILPGTQIGFGNVRYTEIPTDYLAEGMFHRTNLVVGRVAKAFIPARNPVDEAALYPKDHTLSRTLENHERAITLRLPDEALVDHHIVAGDHVDVLVTTVKDGKKYTKTICRDLSVLHAVTRQMLGVRTLNNDTRNRITLASTADQAELLTEAEEAGKVKLILRNRLATEMPKTGGASESDLLPASAKLDVPVKVATMGGQSDVLAPPPPPDFPLPPAPSTQAQAPGLSLPVDPVKWVVEVFSGSNRQTYAFPSGSQ